MRTTILFWSVLITSFLNGQICDDFSENKLKGWQGDTSHFTINDDQQLQLNGSGRNQASLFYPIPQWDSLIWSGQIHLDFSPSASNQLSIILMSSSTSNGPGDNIYMKLGETGLDSLHLFQNVNGKVRKIGSINHLAFQRPFVHFYFKLSRSQDFWAIQIDTLPIVNHIQTTLIADTAEVIYLPYFGIECQYTSSRSDKFWFDDLCIGQEYRDSKGPELSHIEIIDVDHLRLNFDEALDETQRVTLSISPDAKIEQSTISESSILITFADRLQNGSEYTLTLDSISDQNGNWTLNIIDSLLYLMTNYAEPYQLLINEIMADPEPSIGLPSSEYVEIINASDDYFDLLDYTLSDNRTTIFLTDTIIAPGEIILFCPKAKVDLFINTRPVGLTDFPSLNNDGDHLLLQDFAGRIIHQVSYDGSWYQDDGKADGGYALEMIDVKNVCQGAQNWKAANTLLGGSPGMTNSVSHIGEEAVPLELLTALAPIPQQIELIFNQDLESNLSLSSMFFRIHPLIEIKSIKQLPTKPNTVCLQLDSDLEEGKEYEIQISNNLPNCLGISSGLTISQPVYFPFLPDSGDLIINEVLFNPETGGTDFVELLNTTDKFLLLENMYFASFQPHDSQVVRIPNGIHMPPRKTFAFSENIFTLAESNPQTPRENIVHCQLPTLGDDSGNITLLRSIFGRQNIFDALSYDEDWHHALLRDPNGVSLERLCISCLSNDHQNWHSASRQSNYSTPGLTNSQGYISTSSSTEFLHLPYTDLSPNLDGYRDFLLIEIMTDKPGYLLRMNIFDMDGHSVATIADNDLLGKKSAYRWDGIDENDNRSRTGPYFVYAEFLHPNGGVKKIKSAFNLY